MLTPSIRAITRDVAGGSYEITEAKVDENGKPILDKEGKPIFVTVNRPTKVLDLINQRPLIEGEIERRIRPEAQKSCVTIREVRLGEPAIPPELLVAVRREQLATQLARAFIQESAAQEKRVDSEKAKATADQQSQARRIRNQRAALGAERASGAQRGPGRARQARPRSRPARRSKSRCWGRTRPASCANSSSRSRRCEVRQRASGSLTAALTNAHKFVPQTSISLGSGGGSGSLLDAAGLLGGLLTAGQGAPAQPQTATPSRTTGQPPVSR